MSCLAQVNVSESLANLASGAGVSGKTERAVSGPEGNSAGFDPAAAAMAGAKRMHTYPKALFTEAENHAPTRW
jgi:hypothetical protein